MRTIGLLAVTVFAALALWAGEGIVPLNVKPGLWEITSTHSMTGMPAMPTIPEDTLAKMPPEQRARVEAMMKNGMGAPKTETRKDCVTKEKIEKSLAFDDNKRECTRTVLQSTGSRLEMKLHCAGKDQQMTSDGTFAIEAMGSDSAKGSMHLVSNGNGHTINIDFTFTSKYIGPDCGDVK
jgi:hypothetical protein